MKTEGYLYGHYDSRGGATFVIAPTREQADALYVEAFATNEYADDAAQAEEYNKNIIDEDFLGTAELESPHEPVQGEDLEYRDEGDPLRLWVKELYRDKEHHYFLALAAECPDGFEESELGEDACGVVFQNRSW